MSADLKTNRRWLCSVLAGLIAVQAAVFPVGAVSDVTIPVEEIQVVETVPAEVEETVLMPEETISMEMEALEATPEELLPEGNVPGENAPEETVPEETEVPEEAEKQTIDAVPLYFQTDYPDKMYGNGTIESSGCSVTALAMVATYLTDHVYLPDELARYFGGRAENNIERLEMGSEAMQLPWERMENFHKALEALREGKVVIALMDYNSIFTDSQHFIVLTGFNEAGKIMVHDPYEPNYEHWQLERAFREGFDEGDICCGFSGAWAYDKSAMPEEPFLYYEDLPVRGEPRYPDIKLTYEEIRLLAKVIWVEARGESEEGQQAVAEVVLNRLAAENFPDNLRDVIYGQNQFRSVPYLEDAAPGQAQFEAIEAAIYGPYVLPEDVVFFATYKTNENVWGQIGGHIFCYPW